MKPRRLDDPLEQQDHAVDLVIEGNTAGNKGVLLVDALH